jgi:methionyl-tRNA formyltransferase
VARRARELGLPTIQPKTLKDPEVRDRVAAVNPDAGVLAAYGKIIPQALIALFPKGILNVHPSLLPRWRGPTPIQSAILAGDEKTGVTIILLDEEVDHGPILAQRELKMTNDKIQMSNVDYGTLHDTLATLGAELIVETLPKWLAGALPPTPQEHSRATYCKKFTREDAKIDWTQSAEEIDRLVRALNPEPGTWTDAIKIFRVRAIMHDSTQEPGTVFEYEKKPAVQCGGKSAVVLELVQPEGKKPMTGDAFLRGHRGLIGRQFTDPI